MSGLVPWLGQFWGNRQTTDYGVCFEARFVVCRCIKTVDSEAFET